MNVFELFARLGIDTTEFEKGVKNAQGKMKSLASTAGKAVEGVGKGALSIGKAAASAAGSIIDTMENALKTIGTIGGGAMIALGTQAVSAAADIAAENAAFSATFGEMADEAKSAYAIIGEQANILDTRLQKTATKGFSQLKGAGLSANEALEASTRLLNLAADGAAYYDRSLEDTDERLRSFLRGNVEAGDSIGLFTSELQRNNKAVDLYGKKWDKLTESQRQMVMLNIAEEIYNQSGVIGQAARESEGWANVIGNLKEAWRQTLGVIGTPIMDAITPIIQNLTTFLTENQDDLEGFAERLGLIVSLLTTGHEPEAIRAASRMITSFIDTINRELQDGSLEKKGEEIFESLQLGFKRGIAAISDTVELIGPEILAAIVEIKADLLVAGLDLIGALAEGISKDQTDFTETVSGVVQRVSQAVADNAPKMVSGAGALLLALADGLTTEESLAGISSAIESLIDSAVAWIATPGNTAKLTQAFGQLIEAAIGGAFEGIKEDPMGFAYGLLSPLATVIDAITGGELGLQSALDEYYTSYKEGVEDLAEKMEIVNTETDFPSYEEFLEMVPDDLKRTSEAAEELATSLDGLETSASETATAQEKLGQSARDAEEEEISMAEVLGLVTSEAKTTEEQAGVTAEAIKNMFPTVSPDNITGSLSAVEIAMNGVIAKAAAMAAAVSMAFAAGMPSIPGFNSHFATGLERVPYDGFPAILHKDEMVLDRQDANAYRNGDAPGPSKGGVTVNQYIQSVPQTASELAFQTMNALEMLRFSV